MDVHCEGDNVRNRGSSNTFVVSGSAGVEVRLDGCATDMDQCTALREEDSLPDQTSSLNEEENSLDEDAAFSAFNAEAEEDKQLQNSHSKTYEVKHTSENGNLRGESAKYVPSRESRRRLTLHDRKIIERLKSLKDVRISKICAVCHSSSSSVYCGVYCCNRCKVSHRKSVIFQPSLVCKNLENPGDCEINNKIKDTCLSCRVKKCTKFGMTSTGARLRWNNSLKPLPNGTPKSVRVLLKMFRKMFHKYCVRIDEYSITPVLLTDRAIEIGSPSYKQVMFSEFCQLYEPLVSLIIQFSKYIPGVSNLPSDDQMILVKTGFTDFWTILNYKKLNFVKDSITLADSTQIPKSEFAMIYSKQYLMSLEKLASQIRRLKFSLVEKVLLLSLVLVCPDRPNLIEKKRVRDIQSLLSKMICRITSLMKGQTRMAARKTLKSVMSAVHQLGKQHAQIINFYRNHSEKLTLSPVMRELFDLNPQQTYEP